MVTSCLVLPQLSSGVLSAGLQHGLAVHWLLGFPERIAECCELQTSVQCQKLLLCQHNLLIDMLARITFFPSKTELESTVVI